MKYKVTFLPARYGDCIWIEYGADNDTHRILIDGGTKGTKRDIEQLIQSLPQADRHLDLLVVTHIDRDHIEGILSLLEAPALGFSVDAFWFNSWKHLPNNPDDEIFGAVQGEKLTARILHHHLHWNKYFEGKAVVIPADGALPVIQLPGGMVLTLLSPKRANLSTLKEKWEEEVLKANLHPGFGQEEPEEPEDDGIERFGIPDPDVEALIQEEFHEDTAAANGSSIAFLAEFQGKRVLFAGDAYPSVVLESLTKLSNGKVPLDLMKLSHHASAHNTSPELLQKLDCNKYVVSTNGSIFKHPAPVTLARVIQLGGADPELIFNYKSKINEVWDSQTLKLRFNYRTSYPTAEGITVTLLQ